MSAGKSNWAGLHLSTFPSSNSETSHSTPFPKYFMLHPSEHSAVAKLHFAGCSKCHSTNEGATTCSEETSIAAVKDKRRSQKRTSSIREPVPCVVLSCSCLRSFCLVEQPISSIIPSLRIFFFQLMIFLSTTFLFIFLPKIFSPAGVKYPIHKSLLTSRPLGQ